MAQIQRAASSTLPVSHTDLTRIPRFLPLFLARIARCFALRSRVDLVEAVAALLGFEYFT